MVQGTVIKFHEAELDSNFLNNCHSFKEGDIGIFGLAIFQIDFFVFMPKDFGFSVFVFIAVCRFFVFYHLVFSFRKKYERFFGFVIRCAFWVFLFCPIWDPVFLRFEWQFKTRAALFCSFCSLSCNVTPQFPKQYYSS